MITMSYLRDTNPIERTRVHGSAPWHERVLDLWVEDDATRFCEGHETPQSAFARITKQEPKDPIDRFEESGYDYFRVLYRGGWVITYTPSGAEVGVVVCIAPNQGR